MKKSLIAIISIILIFALAGCYESPQNNASKNDGNGFLNIQKDKDIIDTPVEKEIKCDITFEENGGSKVDDLDVIKGSELNKGPKTTRENYLFGGWYLDQSLIEPVIFPLEINSDKTLYAKWIKIKDTQKFKECRLKWDSGYSNSATYSITPSGFEIDELTKKEITGINITISYSVRYIKDYDVPLDIGYAGAPKYEVSIYDQDGKGQFYKDLKTTKTEETHTYEFAITLTDLKTDKLSLKFSTNNIQNIIHFDDITVTYAAAK